MTLTWKEPGTIESSDGWAVRHVDRDLMIYRDSKGEIELPTEIGIGSWESVVIVYWSNAIRWRTSSGYGLNVNADEAATIRKRIQEAYATRNTRVDFDDE